MKQISILAIIVLLLGLSFASCDKIEEGEYIKEGASPWFGRKIVLLDFTGHKCNNCPEGHKAINTLHEKYGDAIVPIAVHCTSFAKPETNSDGKFSYDFRCEEGILLGGDMNLETLPSGLVNSFDPAYIKTSPNSWATDFMKYYSTYPEFSLEINPSFADSTISTNIKVKSEVVCSRNLSMAVYILEDGIISWQKDKAFAPNEDISDYVHNHVLRGSMNTTYGEAINTPTAIGDVIEKSYSRDIKADWNIDNCQIVAFVYDSDTKEILQAETAMVK